MPRVPNQVQAGYSSFHCGEPHCTLRILTPGGQPVEHPCPYAGGTTRVSWTVYGPTLLQATWDEIDELYRRYTEVYRPQADAGGLPPVEHHEMILLQGRMRGIAGVLARFMVPHFDTEDKIVREVAKRYRLKKAGETYETPGLGSRIYEPPPSENKYATKAQQPAPSHTLTPAQVQEIKTDYADWPDDILASTYDTTAAIIKYIKST